MLDSTLPASNKAKLYQKVSKNPKNHKMTPPAVPKTQNNTNSEKMQKEHINASNQTGFKALPCSSGSQLANMLFSFSDNQ